MDARFSHCHSWAGSIYKFLFADNPTGTRKSHLRRARMSNSGLSNRRVRSLPKKMTLSAQPHFLTVQSPQERFKPLDQV